VGLRNQKQPLLEDEIEIVTGWELEDLSGRRSAKFSNFCWHDLPTDFALLNRFGKQKLNFQPSISTLTVQALYEALFFRDRIQKRAEP
jgi:hypothetical protein